MSDYYDPNVPPYDDPVPEWEYDPWFDDLDDSYDCGGTGCGHCDGCDALYERDCINAELRERVEDGDFDEWDGGGTTRFKYPYLGGF